MKTVVIGASPNPARYAFIATERLLSRGHEVLPVGLRKGLINDLAIITDRPSIEDVHTITLYVSARHQPDWQEYIFSLSPKRIILNPGTENPEFEQLANSKGIETIRGCTLVMLSIGTY
jgi:predicted CoA-binding protein